MSKQLKRLAELHPKLEIHLWKFEWSGGRWTCTLSREDGGLALKAQSDHEDPETAVDLAFRKFMQLVEKGAPQLLKVITHQPETTDDRVELNQDDEIPF